MTTTPAPGADLSRLRLGTAPDSWGVWFPDDPHQVPWQQLPRRGRRRAATSGSSWAPTATCRPTPRSCSDELGRRGLQLSGGAVFAGLHRGAEAYEQALQDCRTEARLLGALGARHLVLLPEQYTDMHSGERPGARRARRRRSGTTSSPGCPRSARSCRRSPASRWSSTRTPTATSTPSRGSSGCLQDTDSSSPSRCASTPATSPTAAATTSRSSARSPTGSATCTSSRWTLPSCAAVREESLSFADAVKLGAMVEPPDRHPGDGAPARGARPARRRPVRDRRAGPLPLRAGRTRSRSRLAPAPTSTAAGSGPRPDVDDVTPSRTARRPAAATTEGRHHEARSLAQANHHARGHDGSPGGRSGRLQQRRRPQHQL